MSNETLLNALYASDISYEQTSRECDFIEHFIPLASHPRILDLACETGRHSIELAARGYDVAGIDIDGRALKVAGNMARRRGVTVRFIEGDLREMKALEDRVDGILLFWRSFGFFDDPVQAGLFSHFRKLLRPGGRLILDLYNRLHFPHQTGTMGSLADERMNGLPSRTMALEPPPLSYEENIPFANHLSIELFDPHLHAPGEIAGIAANHRLRLLASCSDFSADIAATPERPHMQLVFEHDQ